MPLKNTASGTSSAEKANNVPRVMLHAARRKAGPQAAAATEHVRAMPAAPAVKPNYTNVHFMFDGATNDLVIREDASVDTLSHAFSFRQEVHRARRPGADFPWEDPR